MGCIDKLSVLLTVLFDSSVITIFGKKQVEDRIFNNIYKQFYKRSYRFVKSYIHADLATEDIVAESLIILWQKIKEEGAMERDPAPLLFTILRNKAYNYLKHEAVKRTAMENLQDLKSYELSIRIASLEACNPNEIFTKDIYKIIDTTLRQLPLQTQKIFRMSRNEGKSNAEIATEITLSEKSVEYHITKTLHALRIALKDYLVVLLFLFT